MNSLLYSTFILPYLTSGSGTGGGINLGTWNAATNTPTLPDVPTAPQYPVGAFYTTTVEGTFQGILYPVGSRIVVNPDGDNLIWGVGDPLPTFAPGGATNSLQFNLNGVDLGGLINSSVNPSTGAVALRSLALGSDGLDLNSSAPIDFFNFDGSSRWTINNSSLATGISKAAFGGATIYSFDNPVESKGLTITNLLNAVILATDGTGQIIAGTPPTGIPGGAVGAIQINLNGTDFGGAGSYTSGADLWTLANLEILTFSTFNNDAMFLQNIISYSPDSSKFSSISMGNDNRLSIENVDELDIANGGFRSNNYVTCTDLYLGNSTAVDYQEVHAFLDNSNIWQFLQSAGTGAVANFQVPVTLAAGFNISNPTTLTWNGALGDPTQYFQLTAEGNNAVFYMNPAASVFVNGGTLIVQDSGNSISIEGGSQVVQFSNVALAANFQGALEYDFDALVNISGNTYAANIDINSGAINVNNGNSLVLRNGSGAWGAYCDTDGNAILHSAIQYIFDNTIVIGGSTDMIFITPLGKQSSWHLDESSGAFIFTVDQGYYNFQGQDVLIDHNLEVTQTIISDGGVDIGAGANIDFLNSDGSARCTLSNDSSTTLVSTALLSNLTFFTIDAPIYPTGIYSSPTVIFIDNQNRIIYDPSNQAVMDFNPSKRIGLIDGVFLDFFNLSGDHSCSITNNGTAGQSIEDHHGADFYRFDNALRFPAWSDSSGTVQASVDVTGFGLPQLTPSTLLGLDASNYVVSIPTSTFATGTRTFNNTPTHAIQTVAAAGNGFQLSTTQDAIVTYSCDIVTTASIGVNSSGTVVLEIAATNSSTAGDWKEIARMTNGQAISVAVALTSTQTTAGCLSGVVPSGYYARLRSINNSGTPSYAFDSGQEVLI